MYGQMLVALALLGGVHLFKDYREFSPYANFITAVFENGFI